MRELAAEPAVTPTTGAMIIAANAPAHTARNTGFLVNAIFNGPCLDPMLVAFPTLLPGTGERRRPLVRNL